MRHTLAAWLILMAVAAFFAGMALRASHHHCAGYAFSAMWAGIGCAVVLGMTGGGGGPPGSAKPRGA